MRLTVILPLAAVAMATSVAAQPGYEISRRNMVANIEQLAAAGALSGATRLDRRVLDVMREVPRHQFVPEAIRHRAYDDTALPIGHQSTISQPFMVATMTHLLRVKPGEKVLEVGAGSGYQAAILSRLGAEVSTIEIVPELARDAERRLRELGYRNITVRAGDGYTGMPDRAPFDAIMVTAGATHVPKPLVAQLKPGGRMLIPLGANDDNQRLTLVTKDADGKVAVRRLGRVVFIPLDERARPRS